MNDEYQWWLAALLASGGVTLLWLLYGKLPRREEDVEAEERLAEARWISERLEETGESAPRELVEQVLELHRAYLVEPPPDAPLRPEYAAPGVAASERVQQEAVPKGPGQTARIQTARVQPAPVRRAPVRPEPVTADSREPAPLPPEGVDAHPLQPEPANGRDVASDSGQGRQVAAESLQRPPVAGESVPGREVTPGPLEERPEQREAQKRPTRRRPRRGEQPEPDLPGAA